MTAGSGDGPAALWDRIERGWQRARLAGTPTSFLHDLGSTREAVLTLAAQQDPGADRVLDRLAAALGATTAWLRTGKGTPPHWEYALGEEVRAWRFQRRLAAVAEVRSLDPVALAAVLGLPMNGIRRALTEGRGPRLAIAQAAARWLDVDEAWLHEGDAPEPPWFERVHRERQARRASDAGGGGRGSPDQRLIDLRLAWRALWDQPHSPVHRRVLPQVKIQRRDAITAYPERVVPFPHIAQLARALGVEPPTSAVIQDAEAREENYQAWLDRTFGASAPAEGVETIHALHLVDDVGQVVAQALQAWAARMQRPRQRILAYQELARRCAGTPGMPWSAWLATLGEALRQTAGYRHIPALFAALLHQRESASTAEGRRQADQVVRQLFSSPIAGEPPWLLADIIALHHQIDPPGLSWTVAPDFDVRADIGERFLAFLVPLEGKVVHQDRLKALYAIQGADPESLVDDLRVWSTAQPPAVIALAKGYWRIAASSPY